MSVPDCRVAAAAAVSVSAGHPYPPPHAPGRPLDEAYWVAAAKAATHTGLDGRPAVPDGYALERLLADLAYTGLIPLARGGDHDAV